jgi:heme-degrading monooxygenase HmoA
VDTSIDTAKANLITIRFLRFKGAKACWNAFAEMGRKLRKPWIADGLVFSKHFGSGAGSGFSILPNFNTYVFLGVWHDEEDANRFFTSNTDWTVLQQSTTEIFGWDAVPIKGHGTWNGKQPFHYSQNPGNWNGEIGVITRATIKWSQAARFWWNVPASQKNIQSHAGMLFSKGIGETPLLELATVSLWKSEADLQQFAYRSKEHAPMVKKTRLYNWFSEEMFMRMAVTKRIGELPPQSL